MQLALGLPEPNRSSQASKSFSPDPSKFENEPHKHKRVELNSDGEPGLMLGLGPWGGIRAV